MILAPHRKHIYGPPRPVTGIALLYIRRLCSYLTGSTHTGPTACYGDSITLPVISPIRTVATAFRDICKRHRRVPGYKSNLCGQSSCLVMGVNFVFVPLSFIPWLKLQPSRLVPKYADKADKRVTDKARTRIYSRK
jgi:hypothetical protein